MRDVTVVDCSKDKRIFPNWLLNKSQEKVPAERREQAVWGEINHALSRPVTPDDPITEYVPTQILAEAFRAHGYDGIIYRSLLGNGHNVALWRSQEIAPHLVSVYGRGDVGGIFVSYSGYSDAAIEDAKTGLVQRVFVLTGLQEIVEILERDGDLKALFKKKINRAKSERNPFFKFPS
jgi:hypothetical protein